MYNIPQWLLDLFAIIILLVFLSIFIRINLIVDPPPIHMPTLFDVKAAKEVMTDII